MTPLPRRIALTPVFNESEVIVSVLNSILPHVDYIIISEDGSTDGTQVILQEWAKDKDNIFLLQARRNCGASAALKKGYILIHLLLEWGFFDPHDLVVEIDSDGQHDPADIPRLMERWLSLEGVNVVLARRDFSNYPLHKVIGNKGLSFIASFLSGFSYKDVESNYRVMPTALFKPLLNYFQGYRYSGAFEVGIILPLLGYKTDNDLEIKVPFYRSGSKIRDGFHVLWTGLKTWYALKRKKPLQDYPLWEKQVFEELVTPLPESK